MLRYAVNKVMNISMLILLYFYLNCCFFDTAALPQSGAVITLLADKTLHFSFGFAFTQSFPLVGVGFSLTVSDFHLDQTFG